MRSLQLDAARYRELLNADFPTEGRPFIAIRVGNGFVQLVGDDADSEVDRAVASDLRYTITAKGKALLEGK